MGSWLSTMLRIHHYFLRYMLIATITVGILTIISSYIILKHVEIKSYEDSLKTIIQTIKISLNKESSLDEYVKEFNNQTSIRISIIDDDGNIVADSSANKSTMENHNNRVELIEARNSEFGVETRYSKTLKSDLLYVTSTVDLDNRQYFIRLSYNLQSVMDSFYILWINSAVVFIIFLGVLFFWANKFNSKIKNEFEKVTKSFSDIENKEYNQAFNFGFAREFVELGLYLKKLSKRLQKRDKQKKKYTTKLKLANKQKSDVISAISHEFKNPVATIMGYAQTLQDERGIDAETKDKFLEKIVKNSQKISDMIDRLSLATKLESGDLTPVISTFDINNCIKEVIDTYKITKPDRLIKYIGEETIIQADEQMMELVIINLIDNALKYSEVDIDISLKDGVFAIQDYGIGVEDDEIDKITNKFYRSNTRSFDNSMGLGLSFVALILNMHNIKLDIKSQVNVGSIFSFKLN